MVGLAYILGTPYPGGPVPKMLVWKLYDDTLTGMFGDMAVGNVNWRCLESVLP